jgi:hypothetical protein
VNERPLTASPPGEVDAFLVERASAIRVLGKRVARDIVEIGRLLAECQDRVGHGGWLEWLEREFGWTDRTALNFMRVHAMAAKSEKISDLPIDASALYLLAQPSTANDIREDVLERAEAGQKITHKEVARLIDEAREKDRFAAKEELERRLARERAKAGEREQEPPAIIFRDPYQENGPADACRAKSLIDCVSRG